MDSHKNARLGFAGRVCLVQRVLKDGWTGAATAAAFHVSERTVWKWVARYQAGGLTALRDGASRPHRSPRQTKRALEPRVVAWRQQRLSGPQIADRLALPLSTVADILRRHGCGQLPPLTPPPPVIRYQRERPGDVDSKKLGRIEAGTIGHRIPGNRAVRGRRGATGWEYLHVAVDDASRVAYAALLPDETAACAFSSKRLLFWPLSASPWKRSGPTTRCATRSGNTRRRWRRTGCGTSAPVPTRLGPMAKRSASSRPRSANGPTSKRTGRRLSVLVRSRASWHRTTSSVRTPHTVVNRPGAVSDYEQPVR